MQVGTERNGSLLAVYISGLAAALAAYTAWLLDQGYRLDDPARVYHGYIKSLDALQGVYQGLAPADKQRARSAAYRLIKAHAYTLTLCLGAAAA